MFSGSINSISHEGGLLLSFGGSSPALDSIIVRASDGVYIGKIDGVLGNTESPMAHVGHLDRKLDLNSLIGEEVTIRAKKPREERYPSRDIRDGGGRRDFDRGSRDRRDGGGRRDGGRGNFDRGSRDRRDGGVRRDFDRGSRDRRDGGGRGERREFTNRDDNREKPKENNFRKSKGKRAGHAHNNAPKPIVPRKFRRNSDD